MRMAELSNEEKRSRGTLAFGVFQRNKSKVGGSAKC